jgi:hypothetical protein
MLLVLFILAAYQTILVIAQPWVVLAMVGVRVLVSHLVLTTVVAIRVLAHIS